MVRKICCVVLVYFDSICEQTKEKCIFGHLAHYGPTHYVL